MMRIIIRLVVRLAVPMAIAASISVPVIGRIIVTAIAIMAIIIAIGLVNLAMRVAYAKRLGRTANYRSFAMERLVGFAAFLAPLAVVGWSVSYYFWSYAVINVVVVLHDAKRMLIDPVPSVAESLAP